MTSIYQPDRWYSSPPEQQNGVCRRGRSGSNPAEICLHGTWGFEWRANSCLRPQRQQWLERTSFWLLPTLRLTDTFYVSSGKTLYSNALGKQSFASDSPAVTTDSVFRIASLTKLVTAVAAMQVVEKGLIGLNDNVGAVVPELAERDVLRGFNDDDGIPVLDRMTQPITLRRLLTHTSGFCYDGFDPRLLRYSASVGRKVDASSMTLAGFDMPLLFQPGESWMYGVGNDWAGRVVEKLTNSSLEEYMKKNIFEPLGMDSTTFLVSTKSWEKRRVETAFRQAQGPLVKGDEQSPSNPEFLSGGSGLYTTPSDYSKLLEALLRGDPEVLSPQSVEELLRPQLDDVPRQVLQEASAGPMHSAMCSEYPPGMQVDYALAGMVNLRDCEGKRRKGSVMWSGYNNSHWVSKNSSPLLFPVL